MVVYDEKLISVREMDVWRLSHQAEAGTPHVILSEADAVLALYSSFPLEAGDGGE